MKFKTFLLKYASVMLLLVAAGGVKPACLGWWYQPKVPE
jgi:cyclic lactone autoinducer peptide